MSSGLSFRLSRAASNPGIAAAGPGSIIACFSPEKRYELINVSYPEIGGLVSNNVRLSVIEIVSIFNTSIFYCPVTTWLYIFNTRVNFIPQCSINITYWRL